MERQGYHRFDDYGWKNSRNSLDNPEKRCPRCKKNLRKRGNPLCNVCSHDREQNEKEIQDTFQELRRLRTQEQRGV